MLSVKNQKVFENLVRVINDSKKSFKDLPQSAIYSYLKSASVDKSAYGSIYDELFRHYNPTTDTKYPVGGDGAKNSPSSKIEVKPMSKSAVVYSQDPKERIPRKSVFGQIVKV